MVSKGKFRTQFCDSVFFCELCVVAQAKKKSLTNILVMDFLDGDTLALIGGFVHIELEEVTAVVHVQQLDDDENFSAKMVKLPSVQARKLVDCSSIPPCLDAFTSSLRYTKYHGLTENGDGSQSFFDAYGNHLTVFTWNGGGGSAFCSVWCDLEKKLIPINYYYYDIFVEKRTEDLPRNVVGRLFKKTEKQSIRFLNGSNLQLKMYTVLLWDKSQPRMVHAMEPSIFCKFGTLINTLHEVEQEVPWKNISVSYFHNATFLSGDGLLTSSLLSAILKSYDKITRPLIRYIRLNSSICIPIRVTVDNFVEVQ